MRRKFVAGNWKMNGALEFCEEFIGTISCEAVGLNTVESVICPPFVYLQKLGDIITDSPISSLGAQNVCAQPNGAYTGEVSASMLQELGCQYIIVGHSERRQMYSETDALICKKIRLVLNMGMRPVICVGETLSEREAGQAESIVTRQLSAVLDSVPVGQLADAVIAYEPVWAIGTGKTATPKEVQQTHALLRRVIENRDATVASKIRIVYGGSVSLANEAELFAEKDVDGGLIGGASLNPNEFLGILKVADQERTC